MSKEILYTRDLGKKALAFCKVALDDQSANINVTHDRLYFDMAKKLECITSALKDTINSKLSNPGTPATFANNPIPFTVTLIEFDPEKNQPILLKDGKVEDPLYNPKTGAIDISLQDKDYNLTRMTGTAQIKVSPLLNGLLELIDMEWKLESKGPDADDGDWIERSEEKVDPEWMDDSDDAEEDDDDEDESEIEDDDFVIDELD